MKFYWKFTYWWIISRYSNALPTPTAWAPPCGDWSNPLVPTVTSLCPQQTPMLCQCRVRAGASWMFRRRLANARDSRRSCEVTCCRPQNFTLHWSQRRGQFDAELLSSPLRFLFYTLSYVNAGLTVVPWGWAVTSRTKESTWCLAQSTLTMAGGVGLRKHLIYPSEGN